MTSARAVSPRLEPEDVLSSAKDFGLRVRLQASHGGIHLHQFDCVPGGWRHEAPTSWRIAYQQTGAPRIHRVVEDSSERQLRPAGKISISPPNAQSWTWDCNNRLAILFISQDIIDEAAADTRVHGCYSQLQTPLLVDDDLIRHTILEMLSECSISSRGDILPVILISALFSLASQRDAKPVRQTVGQHNDGLPRNQRSR